MVHFFLATSKIYDQEQQTFSSAMELIEKKSRTGNSIHIDIRYFWDESRNYFWELDVSYRPAELMLGDYFTKPLKGKSFHEFHDAYANNVTKERVRISEKSWSVMATTDKSYTRT